MSTAADVLREARRLIERPENWIKGTAEAVNKDGEKCYCAIGALEAATESAGRHGPLGHGPLFWAAHRALRDVIPGRLIQVYNDYPGTTHADIVAVFDKAIEKAEQA